MNRIPSKPLSLFIDSYNKAISLDMSDENKKIIKKYIDLGIVKKFKYEYY